MVVAGAEVEVVGEPVVFWARARAMSIAAMPQRAETCILGGFGEKKAVWSWILTGVEVGL